MIRIIGKNGVYPVLLPTKSHPLVYRTKTILVQKPVKIT